MFLNFIDQTIEILEVWSVKLMFFIDKSK